MLKNLNLINYFPEGETSLLEKETGISKEVLAIIPKEIKQLLFLETDKFYEVISSLEDGQLTALANKIYEFSMSATNINKERFGINFLTGIPFEGILSQGFRTSRGLQLDYWILKENDDEASVLDLMSTMDKSFGTSGSAMVIDRKKVQEIGEEINIGVGTNSSGVKNISTRSTFTRLEDQGYLPKSLNLFPVGFDYGSSPYTRAYYETIVNKAPSKKLIPNNLLRKHREFIKEQKFKRKPKTDIIFAAFRWAEALGCWIGTNDTENDN